MTSAQAERLIALLEKQQIQQDALLKILQQLADILKMQLRA